MQNTPNYQLNQNQQRSSRPPGVQSPSYSYHCVQLRYTIHSTEQLGEIIFPVILQTITSAQTMSVGRVSAQTTALKFTQQYTLHERTKPEKTQPYYSIQYC